ncbi:MAG: class I SAM-dependent methyltransferase [Oscillospiraceae bacterium]|jgi:ubiquinone/menaquinone biosynthesis C-methylase UbiE|nr:class I SAM-dependent methyltransferase [Oscillospiraceae bacterium]
MINTKGFTGKAQAYAEARPGYSNESINYIRSLAPKDAVIADIGAGTGKFTELIARAGYEIFAIEPNEDMREQLYLTLLPFSNVSIIGSTAEKTTLSDKSIDLIICSQSLGWLDLSAFKEECRRIGKHNCFVVSLFNETPGDKPAVNSHRYTSAQASEIFFSNPIIREFPNPVKYTREKWLQFNASISDNPSPQAPDYDTYINRINLTFDRYNEDGLILCNFTTKVYCEMIT